MNKQSSSYQVPAGVWSAQTGPYKSIYDIPSGFNVTPQGTFQHDSAAAPWNVAGAAPGMGWGASAPMPTFGKAAWSPYADAPEDFGYDSPGGNQSGYYGQVPSQSLGGVPLVPPNPATTPYASYGAGYQQQAPRQQPQGMAAQANPWA